MFKKIWKKLKTFLNEFWICVKNTCALIVRNWVPVTIFAGLNIFISIFGTTFFADQALNIIYRVSDISYIGQDNLYKFILSPATILCLLAFMIIIGAISIFEISSLLHAFSMSQIGKKTTFSSMISTGVRTCRKVVYPKNWIMFPFVLIILPFTGIINLASSMISVSIPGFILDFIFANALYATLFLIVSIILSLVVLLNLHALNFFAIADNSFVTSCKKSKDLMKHNVWSTLLYLLCFSIVFMVVITAISSTIGSLIAKVITFFNTDPSEVLNQRLILAKVISVAEKFFTGLALPLLNLASLATLFFKKIDEQNKISELPQENFSEKNASRAVLIACSIIGLVILCYNFWSIGVRTVAYMDDVVEKEIIAHRGDSVYAPENTMPAFELALDEDVDGVELDVHETKDGVIIVSHDDNLLRVSGKDVYVHDLTYEEIKKLEVGSWFNQKYAGTRLSTLDEVLKLFKDTDTEIQIEIKPTEYDHQIEEKVIEIINKNDMRDSCIVISLKDAPLKRIKELDKNIRTGFCMFIAMGDVQDIDFADCLSIEESFISPFLVYKAHKVGKKVYTWTINDQTSIQYLVYSNVNGMLTDDPLMLWDALTKVDYDNGIMKVLYLAINKMVKGY